MKRVTNLIALSALLALATTTKSSAQNPVPPTPAQPGEAARLASVGFFSQVTTQEFVFQGGSFEDFVKALRKTYGTNALALFDYPTDPLAFRIPRMRVPANTWDIRGALALYNSTSEAGDWYLGKWIYLPTVQYTYGGADNSLRTLSFLPPKMAGPGSGSGIAVRAFSIGRLGPDSQRILREIVELESQKLENIIATGHYGRQDPSEARGSISIHESSGLLVASGGKTFVELVASVVEAFEKR